MNYRDIAFSKAKEYGLEIVENYQFDRLEGIDTEARLSGKRILVNHSIEDGKDMLTIFHEIGHFILGHSIELPQYSKSGIVPESLIRWINKEIEAWQKAFEFASDTILEREDIRDCIETLSNNMLYIAERIRCDVKDGEELIGNLPKQWRETMIDIVMQYKLLKSKEEAIEIVNEATSRAFLKHHAERGKSSEPQTRCWRSRAR